MAREDDIAQIIAQEKGLVFSRFDEGVAFSIGMRIRERALREGLSLVADLRTWDRPLFYTALAGTTGDNQHWVRRKFNLVQRVSKSSYRVVLENTSGVNYFQPNRGMSNEDYVMAGGGFPIRIDGVGVIGCVTVSGLPERQDHNVAVQAICEELGRDSAAFALPPA
jgi:uncharacterized protein (UPF0303 family)